MHAIKSRLCDNSLYGTCPFRAAITGNPVMDMETVFLEVIYYRELRSETDKQVKHLCLPKGMLITENGSLTNLYLYLEKLFPEDALHRDFVIYIQGDDKEWIKLESSSVLKHEIEKTPSGKFTVYFKRNCDEIKEICNEMEKSNLESNCSRDSSVTVCSDLSDAQEWDLVDFTERIEEPAKNEICRHSLENIENMIEIHKVLEDPVKNKIFAHSIEKTEDDASTIGYAMKAGNLHDLTASPVDIHEFTVCDGCDDRVCGFRFNCLQCADYDLCNSCFQAKKHAASNHVMLCLPMSDQRFFWQDLTKSYLDSRMNEVLKERADDTCDVEHVISDETTNNGPDMSDISPNSNLHSASVESETGVKKCENEIGNVFVEETTTDGPNISDISPNSKPHSASVKPETDVKNCKEYMMWVECLKTLKTNASNFLEHFGIETMSHTDAPYFMPDSCNENVDIKDHATDRTLVVNFDDKSLNSQDFQSIHRNTGAANISCGEHNASKQQADPFEISNTLYTSSETINKWLQDSESTHENNNQHGGAGNITTVESTHVDGAGNFTTVESTHVDGAYAIRNSYCNTSVIENNGKKG
ncbi:Protein ref(2)P [Nymphon striatum]|nr:Protein ref(2)P [Nymphon striatum]